MDRLCEIVSALFLVVGAFFALTAGVGILRMPDFYSRTHPAGKSDTLGQTLIMIGLFFLALRADGLGMLVGIKLLLVVVLLFLTAPTAVHAIVRAAHGDGLEAWRKRDRDDE